MSIAELEKAITPNTSAVMPVHIYGHPVHMEPLLKITQKHNLKIIEDAAEVHGATCRVNGEWPKCGSFGEVSSFSLFANKNITCGEGGMVLTNDEDIYHKMVARRTLCFGKHERFCHEDRGWNFRMTNLQAALGCAQLENIDFFLKGKRSMAETYNAGLQGLPLQLPFVEDWATSTVWMYAVLLKDEVPFEADEFAKLLMEQGVQTRPFFRGLHTQKVYLDRGLIGRFDCPVTEKIYQRGLYLPSGQAITDEQIQRVIETVMEVLS
jgi:perosamine synthetase